MESTLRPRDIQTRIRAGETPEAVAHAAGTSVEKIMPFAAPVMAERAHVAQRAQLASVRRRASESGARTLGEAVSAHLRSHNVDPGAVEWDAWRREDGRWTLTGAVRRRRPHRHRDLLPRPARQLRDRRRRRRPLAGRRRPRRPRRRRTDEPAADDLAAARQRRLSAVRRRARLRRGRDRDGRRRDESAADDESATETTMEIGEATLGTEQPVEAYLDDEPADEPRDATSCRPDERAGRREHAAEAPEPDAREEARPRLGAELGRDHVRRRQERLSGAPGRAQRPPPQVRSHPAGPLDRRAARRAARTTARGWSSTRDGRLVSAREVHALFHVVADTPATDPAVDGGAAAAGARARPTCSSTSPTVEPEPVRLFSLDLRAVPRRDPRPTRGCARRSAATTYAWCGATTRPRRTLQPGYSQPGDHAAFADSFPVTVASLASLRQLNDWIVERALELGEEPPDPLPIERFRANLVVDGDEPFAEDRWQDCRVGGVRFRVAKPVGRCVMTTHRPGRR